jgi:hypothetical protein
MPISDDALHNPKNQFIAVTADAKLGQAIAAYKDVRGQPWWHLVVQKDDGSWATATFIERDDLLGGAPDAAEIRLGDADALPAAAAAGRNSIETKAAQALARKAPARVLVVTDKGMPVGILVEGVTRAAAAPSRSADGLVTPSARLDALGGKYIDLKNYGSILLGSSKMSRDTNLKP